MPVNHALSVRRFVAGSRATVFVWGCETTDSPLLTS